MPKLKNTFRTADYYEEKQTYTPLDEGQYLTTIIEADTASTKAGNGSLLKVVYQTQTERLVYDQFLLAHPSEGAVALGRKKLANLLKAVRIDELNDTDQLLKKEVVIDVTIDGQWNRVADHHPAPSTLSEEDVPF